jgi:hypothetical protein
MAEIFGSGDIPHPSKIIRSTFLFMVFVLVDVTKLRFLRK